MQLMSEVFEGAGKQNAIFSGFCHTIIAVSLVLFKSVYGPLWYVHPSLLPQCAPLERWVLSSGANALLCARPCWVGKGRNLEHQCPATGCDRVSSCRFATTAL
jgi:hypothetical protein